MESIAFELPFPPSTNTYWRHVGFKTLLSAKGRQYREDVAAAVGRVLRMDGRLRVSIVAYPPDRRRRDLDNMLKAALDSLTHSGVWEDDSQIDSLTIQRGEVRPDGCLEVFVDVITEPPHA